MTRAAWRGRLGALTYVHTYMHACMHTYILHRAVEEAAFAKITQEPLTHEAKVDARLNAMEQKLNNIVTVVLNVERQIVSGKMSA